MNNLGISNAAWKSWQELNQSIQGKEVVFFGVADNWVGKTLQKSLIESFYFVDNNEGWHKEKFLGADVTSPEILKEEKEKRFVIITSGAYESIYPQLIDYNLIPGTDFCISPALQNLKIISDIHSHQAKLLISSPDHKLYSQLDQNNDIGGGLFTYDIQTHECKKVFEGTFHQIVDTGESYYLADEEKGICHVSKDFELIDVFAEGEGVKSHGVAYCPERKLVFLSSTGKDKIFVYASETRKMVSEISFSDKISKVKKPAHWVNDLFVKGNYLYASMFSHTGSFLEGVYDGGVAQINIDDPTDRHVLISGLWMPHSVCFFDSEICILDSMNGYFYKTDKNIIGEFFGFVRGIGFDGVYYYIGQSETRYFDRLKGKRKNIGMSAGFYLFDEETKACKFYTIPQIHQVRDIVVI